LILHYIHSSDPRTGGVLEAARNLDGELNRQGVPSMLCFDPKELHQGVTMVIAHGLWQWPSVVAYREYLRTGTPYLVYPHGMLDPWFKKSNPIKHIKKQFYWWWRQGKILKRASAVCFTTEEERQLAKKTFIPYRCNEVVTGLGLQESPNEINKQKKAFYNLHPELKGKRVLLFLGRIHPKKGVDLLLDSFSRFHEENDALVLAGPKNEGNDGFIKKIEKKSKAIGKNVYFTGMVSGDVKWGALRIADALILPSHQENFGIVVAEALSVGTPVYLTDKVNLWREVINANAGIVSKDDAHGIDDLLRKWKGRKHLEMKVNTRQCFQRHFHIRETVMQLLDLCRSLKLI